MAMLQAPSVCLNGSHTCIVVKVTARSIFAIPMGILLELKEYGVAQFHREYKMTDYPPHKAARSYLNADPIITATEPARRQLENIAAVEPLNVFLTKHDQEQARRFLALEKGEPYAPPSDIVTKLFQTSGARKGLADSATHPSRLQENQMATAAKGKKEPAKKETASTGKSKKAAAPAKAAPAAKKTKGAPAAEEKTGGRKPGVGSLIVEMLMGGHETEDIVMAIREKFPESKSEAKDVSWYRSKLKREGKL